MLAPLGNFDPPRGLVEAPEAERPEVHVPLLLIDRDEPDVFAADGLADIHPVAGPADAPVVTDAADLIVARRLQRWQSGRIRPQRRRPIERSRRGILQRPVRPQPLHSVRQTSNRRRCARCKAFGGRVHSAFSVRCIRS